MLRFLLMLNLLWLPFLMACTNHDEGPAEKAGENIDEAARSVGESIEETTEDWDDEREEDRRD